MPNMTSEQVGRIADSLRIIAKAIGEFRIKNYIKMSHGQIASIESLQEQILQQADNLYTESAILVMDDIQNSLTTIEKVTAEIQQTIKSLQDIQKTIDIATSVLNLGAAILSKNPQSIGKSIVELIKNVKDI
jgi:hypoxanthine phosphoribosyltransferase